MQDISRQPSTMNASWSNLWDQTELVSSHTQKGIDFLERYGQFLKERATIEEEYASKLRSLVKKSRVKKNEEESKLYSYMNAFFSILSELESIAAQHEVIGEKLKREVVPTLIEKSHILRTSRKKHCNTFQALNTNLQESEDSMLKAQKVYQKAFREAEIAYAKHEKAEKNMDLSRLDLERAKNNVHQKNQHCEQAKQNYAHSLELANHAQHDHYNMKLPNLLEDMRKLDMDRIDSTKQAMLDSVHAETSVSNILQRCYSDMETSILSINSEIDTSVVVVEHRTGFAFPKEHIFEDLGCPSSILCGNGESVLDITGTLKRTTISVGGAKIGKNINGKGIPRKSSMHQRLFGGNANSKSNNNGSSTDGYSNLPPQQRCRKIQFKLDELAKETILKEQARAGLEKMLGVFRENPKMGNANDVDLQLQQNNKELELIAEKADRYKRLLIDAQSELNTPLKGIQESQHHNALRNVSSYSTTGLSPNGSSPRINASTTSLVSSSVTQQRSSYSEDSVSSEGTSSMNDANNSGFLRSSLNSSLTTNTSNAGGNSNGFYNKSSSALASKSNISVAPSVFSNVSVGNNNNGIQHVDSTDFYEECDALPKANSLKNLKGTENGISENSSILGTCTALYAFEGSSDGTTIAMKEGDEMLLLERDEGDGWTRVRLINSGAGDVLPMEGFVPTTYLQCRWYP